MDDGVEPTIRRLLSEELVGGRQSRSPHGQSILTGSPSSQRKHDSGGRESEFTMISHDLEATTSVVSTASVFYDLEATITVVVYTASVFYELHVWPVSVTLFVLRIPFAFLAL